MIKPSRVCASRRKNAVTSNSNASANPAILITPSVRVTNEPAISLAFGKPNERKTPNAAGATTAPKKSAAPSHAASKANRVTLIKLLDCRQQPDQRRSDLWHGYLASISDAQRPRQRRIEVQLIIVKVQRHENSATESRKLFFCPQVHLSRRARPPDVQMMKRNRRLDHRLEKQFLLWTNLAHPTLFPRVVRRMKLALVVKIDPGDVFNRIRRDMRVGVGDFERCFHGLSHLVFYSVGTK